MDNVTRMKNSSWLQQEPEADKQGAVEKLELTEKSMKVEINGEAVESIVNSAPRTEMEIKLRERGETRSLSVFAVNSGNSGIRSNTIYDPTKDSTIKKEFANEIRSKYSFRPRALLWAISATVVLMPFFIPNSTAGGAVLAGPITIGCLTSLAFIYYLITAELPPSIIFNRSDSLSDSDNVNKGHLYQPSWKRIGFIGRFFRAAALLLQWETYYDEEKIPATLPILLLTCYPITLILLWFGWNLMWETPYKACGGLEGTIEDYGCNKTDVGSLYKNFTVTLVYYRGPPLAGFTVPEELATIQYETVFPIFTYLISFALISCMIAWETTVEYKKVMEREEAIIKDALSQDKSNDLSESYSQAIAVIKNIKLKKMKEGINICKTRSCSWRVYSLLSGMATGFALPAYCIYWYSSTMSAREIPLLLGVFLVACVSIWGLTRTLQWVSLSYYENYMLMVLLYHLDVDFENKAQFRNWRRLRDFELTYVMDRNYGLSQWTFAGFLTFLFFAVLTITVRIVVVEKTLRALTFFGMMFLFILTVYSGGIIFHLMSSAVNIWMAQERHLELLQRHKIDLRSMIHDNDNFERDQQILGTRVAQIESLVTYMETYDIPPKVFGIAIRPHLFILLKGYIASAITLTGISEFLRNPH